MIAIELALQFFTQIRCKRGRCEWWRNNIRENCRITLTLQKLLSDYSPSKLMLDCVTFLNCLLDFLCFVSSESPHFTRAKQGKKQLLVHLTFETCLFVLLSCITSLFVKSCCITSPFQYYFESPHLCNCCTVRLRHFSQLL